MADHQHVPVGARIGDPDAPKIKRRKLKAGENTRRKRLHAGAETKEQLERQVERAEALGNTEPIELCSRVVAATRKALAGDSAELEALDAILNPPPRKKAAKGKAGS